jgi:hypothetical protein
LENFPYPTKLLRDGKFSIIGGSMHFDSKNHVYFDDESNMVDGFSQIIKAINLIYFPPNSSKAQRGTKMHTAIEMHESGKWNEMFSDEDTDQAIKTYEIFKKGFVKDIIAFELPFIAYSTEDGKRENLWAGCADLVFINPDGAMAIADFKSGKVYEHHKLQLTAYALGLWPGIKICYSVYLDSGETVIHHPWDYADHWFGVLSAYYFKKKRRLYNFDRVLQNDVEFNDTKARDAFNAHKDQRKVW